MKAIGFKESLPISRENSFIEFETSKPIPGKNDLLIKVKAVSVNPVDFKIRQNSAIGIELVRPKIIGWDAVGVVEKIGEDVTLFQIADEVFYSGDVTMQGCNAEYQIVNEGLVGRKPKGVCNMEAAVMPLASLKVWELLFNRICVNRETDYGKIVVIIGGSGGLGSIAIQLAKKIVGLTVISTVSDLKNAYWCKRQGADFVINENKLVSSVRKIGFEHVDFILDFVNVSLHWDEMIELIKPKGHIASVTDNDETIDLIKLKSKNVFFSRELTTTNSMSEIGNSKKHHMTLNIISDLMERGIIISILEEVFVGFKAKNFTKAHQLLECGDVIGKIAIMF